MAISSERRLKQVYRITFPNGKIYVDLDLTGTLTYLGSPSAVRQIAEDMSPEQRRDFSVRKTILWESREATDAEARAMEIDYIVSTRANDPAVGYNIVPRPRS